MAMVAICNANSNSQPRFFKKQRRLINLQKTITDLAIVFAYSFYTILSHLVPAANLPINYFWKISALKSRGGDEELNLYRISDSITLLIIR